jgi:hypothetical protein
MTEDIKSVKNIKEILIIFKTPLKYANITRTKTARNTTETKRILTICYAER